MICLLAHMIIMAYIERMLALYVDNGNGVVYVRYKQPMSTRTHVWVRIVSAIWYRFFNQYNLSY